MDDEMIARVRQIIDQHDSTQRAFAEQIQLDESKLTKSLTGRRRFSSSELARIAEIGGRTVEWLLSGVEPRSMVFAHRSALDDRAVATTTGREVLGTVAERYQGLEVLDLAPPTVEWPAVPGGWSFVAAASQMADAAAKQLDQSVLDLPIADLIDAIEDRFGIDVIVTRLPGTCDGLSYQDGAFRAIVLGATDMAARQRYTLAHELGHLLFGDAQQGLIEEEVLTPGVKSIEEKRADAFAAAFLVPKQQLLELIGSRDAADAFDDAVWRFGISPDALSWRMLNLELIDGDQRRLLAEGSSARSASAIGEMEAHLARMQASSQLRPPMRLAMAAVRAYMEGEIAIGPVAILLQRSEDDARKMLESSAPDAAMSVDNPETI
jgi:Zn-dependent peptidase ImmA (M78 family)/transcriptional regulator with XRE-family HTH domain